MKKTKVVVRVRKFAPSRLPSVLINDKDNERNKQLEQLAKVNSLFGGIDLITKEFLKAEREPTLYLNLNSLNELIYKLTEIEDSSNDEIKDVFLGLFTTAILYSQNNLSEHNTNVIYDQFISLFTKLLNYQEKIKEKQNIVEALRGIINIKNEEEWWNAPIKYEDGHIILFVIMPFKEEYNKFFEAIKLVFECHPYYFEIIRADDKTFAETILDNIIEHYKRANGFVIELSELNPNVFYELGALSPFENKRSILKFRNSDAEKLPTDLGGSLYIKYSSKEKEPSILAEEIKKLLFKDGRFTNQTLIDLLKNRKKRYLSIKMLENEISIKFTSEQVENILKNYKNIEDLINEDISIIIEKTGLTEAKINAIQDDFKKQCK